MFICYNFCYKQVILWHFLVLCISLFWV